jgi:hypothetical protein
LAGNGSAADVRDALATLVAVYGNKQSPLTEAS